MSMYTLPPFWLCFSYFIHGLTFIFHLQLCLPASSRRLLRMSISSMSSSLSVILLHRLHQLSPQLATLRPNMGSRRGHSTTEMDSSDSSAKARPTPTPTPTPITRRPQNR